MNTTNLLSTLAQIGRNQWLGGTDPIDWSAPSPELSELAQQEGMTLALSSGFAIRKSPEVHPELSQQWQRNGEALARNLKALRHLGEEAAKENIQIIPLKGALYSIINLPHALQRITGDVDVMVPSHQLPAALALLQRQGYQPERHDSPHRFHAEILNRWLPITSSLNGRDPLHGRETSIDLHWDPLYFVSGTKARFKLERLWEESTAPLIEFPSLKIPPPAFITAHVLAHAVHHAQQSGLRLMALFDLAVCIHKIPAPFKEALEYLSLESPQVATPKLAEFWEAATELKSGNLKPFLKLRDEKPYVKGLGRPWLETFKAIGSLQDRAKFLLGYFLKKGA